MAKANDPILELRNLYVTFKLDQKNTVNAVSNASLIINQGDTVGLVGESGCGKTTLGRTIKSVYAPLKGEILYKGQDIHKMTKADKQKYTQEVQMIFQDPYSSLDPRMTVREIIKEGMRAHKLGTQEEMNQKVYDLLETVGLSKEHAERFPHEFSGGQRQRIGIARALAVDPKFIVCDEPTSALDVSVQAQVIKLFNRLKEELGLTYLFISHDLSMVKYVSDKVAVMYLGRIVEIAPAKKLYDNPQHPYTKTLLSAVQIPDPKVERAREKMPIIGDIQSPINLSEVGCHFAPRCLWKTERCLTTAPEMIEIEPGHFTMCTEAAKHKNGA